MNEIEALKMELEFANRRADRAEERLRESRAAYIKMVNQCDAARLRLDQIGRILGVSGADAQHELIAGFRAMGWEGGPGFVAWCKRVVAK